MKSFLFLIMFSLFITSPLLAADEREAEFLRRGTDYFQAKNYERAAKAFSQAARLNPESAEAHKGLGLAYLRLGLTGTATNVEMVDNAVAALRNFLRLVPGSAEIRYEVGVASLTLDDKPGAVKEYEALKALDARLAEQLRTRIAAYKPPKSFRTLMAGGNVEGSSTRVTIANNSVLVPTTLTHGGKTVQATLVFDTGASTTFITREVAKRLGLDLDHAKQANFEVADGRVVQGLVTAVDQISVGPKSKNGLVVSVAQKEGKITYDGLLGMDFLRNFKHSIDFTNQVINWAQ